MKCIKIKFTQEGLHQYIDAPDDVDYLKHIHRHLFHISVKLEVYHNDRELEFLMVMHNIQTFVVNNFKQDNEPYIMINSCEMLAEEILKFVAFLYGKERYCEVEVSEDNENSAIVDNR